MKTVKKVVKVVEARIDSRMKLQTKAMFGKEARKPVTFKV